MNRGAGVRVPRALYVAVGILACVALGAGVAVAAIPNGSTYNACALKKTGALRVIDTGKHQKCKSTETKLSWSKTGAAGAQGTTGPSGVVHLVTIGGPAADSIVLGSPQYIGPTASVTVGSGQSIVGSVSAASGSTAGATSEVDLCYDHGGSPTIGANFTSVQVDATRRMDTVNEAFAVAPGTYHVGFCDVGGTGTLNNNDYVQGWVMVVTRS